MNAAVLAIGTELLGIDRLDTNSLRLTRELEAHGVRLVRKAVVGDDETAIVRELERATEDAGLVLVSGGLGPTEDDRTRAAVARFCGRGMRVDEAVVESIRAMFRRFGREMPEVNRRQAEVIEGAEVLHNDRGTAPGQRLEAAGATIFLFPGVPRELDGLIESALAPWLTQHAKGARIASIELRVACLAESTVQERIGPLWRELGEDAIVVLAGAGDIRVRLRAPADEPQRLADVRREVVRLLAGSVFDDGQAQLLEPGPSLDLEAVVGQRLLDRRQTLVTAESCTGGWVGQRLTAVPGSSAWYLGGVVSYSNNLKSQLLGVRERLIEEHGAVSEAVALRMASGARERLLGDWAISITGIAGPGGGSAEKPVGTVHFAVAGPEGERHHRAVFPGDRQRIRLLATQFALDLLRRWLENRSAATAYEEFYSEVRS